MASIIENVNIRIPEGVAGLFGRRRRNDRSTIETIQRAVCYNQGKLAEYPYIAAERHRDLRNAIDSPDPDIDQVQRCCENLDSYLLTEFETVAKQNFDYIIGEYYKGRGGFDVRACIKAYQEGRIVTVLRDTVAIPNEDQPLDANTAFEQIYETGGPYLCNNIPEAFKKKTYKNSRINQQQALQYTPPRRTTFKRRSKGDADGEWIRCWIAPQAEDGMSWDLPPETCYKSTLVIPMTLVNNQLRPEFKEVFGATDNSGKKSVFGFLCLDNHEADYFKKEDISIGYVFADLLSLYLIQRYSLVVNSTTFRRAQHLIEEADND